MPARSDARIRTPPLAHDSNSSSDEGRARARLFQVAASGNSPESVPGQGQITSASPAWYCRGAQERTLKVSRPGGQSAPLACKVEPPRLIRPASSTICDANGQGLRGDAIRDNLQVEIGRASCRERLV